MKNTGYFIKITTQKAEMYLKIHGCSYDIASYFFRPSKVLSILPQVSVGASSE